jgi:predicted anti-sigma-YlaC factor YlaD
MSERADDRHPDELLSDYVDGRLDDEARATVERHLATCPRCREDLVSARTGARALASLPEVDPPGLADGSLDWLTPAGPVVDLATRGADGRTRWQRATVAVAAAAVVVVLAGVITASLSHSEKQASTSAGARAPSAAATQSGFGGALVSGPVVVDQGRLYTAATIEDLAHRLAADVEASVPPGSSPSASGQGQAPGKVGTSPLDPATVAGCLARGAGLASNDTPLYLEAASYQGAPAYIGGFRTTDSHPAFLLVVVGRTDCSILYEARQPL